MMELTRMERRRCLIFYDEISTNVGYYQLMETDREWKILIMPTGIIEGNYQGWGCILDEMSCTPRELEITGGYHSHTELSFLCMFSDGEPPVTYISHDNFVFFWLGTNIASGMWSRLRSLGAASRFRSFYSDLKFFLDSRTYSLPSWYWHLCSITLLLEANAYGSDRWCWPGPLIFQGESSWFSLRRYYEM